MNGRRIGAPGTGDRSGCSTDGASCADQVSGRTGFVVIRGSGDHALPVNSGTISTPSWCIARPNCVRRIRSTPATCFRGHKLRREQAPVQQHPPATALASGAGDACPAPAPSSPTRHAEGSASPTCSCASPVLAPVEAVEVLHVSFHFFCGSQSTDAPCIVASATGLVDRRSSSAARRGTSPTLRTQRARGRFGSASDSEMGRM